MIAKLKPVNERFRLRMYLWQLIFISKNNGNELGDSCKDEICMECFILGSAPGEAEMLFDVIIPRSTTVLILYVLSHSSVPRIAPG